MSNKNTIAFGQIFKKLLEASGLHQSELVSKMGQDVDDRKIRYWLKGERKPPTYHQFIKLVKIFADQLTATRAQQWGALLEYELKPYDLALIFPDNPVARQDERAEPVVAPTQTLQQFRRQMLDQFGNFSLHTVERIVTVSFQDWGIIPKLRLRSDNTLKDIKDLLNRPDVKICICGAPGSGKTIMSQFAVWHIATQCDLQDETSYLPLPIKGAQMNGSEGALERGIAAISLAQQVNNSQLSDKAFLLSGWLHANKSRLIPVIDDWNQAGTQEGGIFHSRIIEKDVRNYTRYILFSRRPAPRLKVENIAVYEIGALTDQQIKAFIFIWGTLFKQPVQKLYNAIMRQQTERLIKTIARTPLGLVSLCQYFAETQKLPASSHELVIDMVEILLARELQRLGLSDDYDIRIVRILRELAWRFYISPDGKPRKTVLESIKIYEARRFFNSDERQLLTHLYGSQFLRIQHSDSAQRRLAFHFEWQRDFYAAEKLLSLGERGCDIEMQATGRQDWQNVLKIYGQLMSERRNT